jgi:large subunit ribosomal protein L6
MSRIGKHPVSVPKGVQVALAGQTLTFRAARRLDAAAQEVGRQEDGAYGAAARQRRGRGPCGACRALVANMVEGVSKGFTGGW